MFTEHDKDQIFTEETLEPISYPSSAFHQPRSPSPPPLPLNSRIRYYPTDPGSAVLVHHLGPNYQDLVQAHQTCEDDHTETASVLSSHTVDSMDEAQAQEPAGPDDVPKKSPASDAAAKDQNSVNVELATKALEISADPTAQSKDQLQKARPPPTERVDSAHDEEEPPSESNSSGNSSSTARPTPPRLQTARSHPDETSTVAGAIDTIAASPTLSKHIRPVTEGDQNTLPIVQPTSPAQGRDDAGSPQKLPSFKQLTQLADAAMTREPQLPPPPQQPQLGRPHSQSFSSTTAQSPRLPYHPYNGSSQTSPTYSARSPTSTIGEIGHYGSPTQFPGSAYYAARRRSSVITDGPPPYPPTLQSASSSGESHGHASSTDGAYSTAHTTPIDGAQVAQSPLAMMDGSGRPIPILPPPPGMPQHLVHGVFRCDQPGCQAPPFQTQYLLTSHKNVHSSVRAHYCPVEGCPRAEGGRGFKRKNEMIRHGLVHSSPGYICPFCPDRDHKYPRPDNLQRHVRVHHVDKDRDNAALREVLAQRIEGPGKQRRRRTNQHGTATG